jgi:hypothetical protein
LNGSANAYFVKAHDKYTTKVALWPSIEAYQLRQYGIMVMGADKGEAERPATLLTIIYFPLDRSEPVPHRG